MDALHSCSMVLLRSRCMLLLLLRCPMLQGLVGHHMDSPTLQHAIRQSPAMLVQSPAAEWLNGRITEWMHIRHSAAESVKPKEQLVTCAQCHLLGCSCGWRGGGAWLGALRQAARTGTYQELAPSSTCFGQARCLRSSFSGIRPFSDLQLRPSSTTPKTSTRQPTSRQRPTGSRSTTIPSKAPTIIDISRAGATTLSGAPRSNAIRTKM